MKILIADDGGRKAETLVPFLVRKGLVDERDVLVAEYGVQARNILRSEQIDLLVLDILLPWRERDDPALAGSASLLDSIVYDEDVMKPTRIVGLTADDDAAREAGPGFAAQMWTILRFDETSSAWMEAIAASIEYMRQQTTSRPSYDTDLLVITALRDPEMEAVHKLPWNWQAEGPIDDTTFVRRGTFQSAGGDYSVVTSVADRMGMVSTAVLATKLMEKLRPRFCVMVGICAGLEKETRFGDVLLIDPSWDYQSGKRVKEEDGSHTFKIDPHQLPVSLVVRSRIKDLALDRSLLDTIRRARDDDPGHDLRILVGPVATGSAVIADEDKVLEVKDQQRKMIGIEMEAYGLYVAASHCGLPKPTAFALKAVSDFADHKKEDTAQKYAAYTSALVTRHFFERYMHDIVSSAGH